MFNMVLGIDPGLASCGWAILSDAQTLIRSGCIVTKKADDLASRLDQIYCQTEDLCRQHKIDELAIESLFFAKNTKTALLVAQAMGAIKAAADNAGAKVFEYTPLQIKIAITGYGRAQKDQVVSMIRQSLGESVVLGNNHASDAIAAALTHLFTLKKEQLI
ncbi:MAG: crossover junction endodeoxyribonuclease RuvC [Candidatus Shapirobacteria bacterium]|nr:crossover junction endodeoxyribonuclease RuvC [Candidatus Shapirobacteria bacterium]